jgi:hypothetical protein
MVMDIVAAMRLVLAAQYDFLGWPFEKWLNDREIATKRASWIDLAIGGIENVLISVYLISEMPFHDPLRPTIVRADCRFCETMQHLGQREGL